MIASYYVSQMLLFGFFATRLLLAWTAVMLFLTPPIAALAWHARRCGWPGALGGELSAGLLLGEAYSLRRLRTTKFYLYSNTFRNEWATHNVDDESGLDDSTYTTNESEP